MKVRKRKYCASTHSSVSQEHLLEGQEVRERQQHVEDIA